MTTDDLNLALDDEFERCTPDISIVPSEVVIRGRRRVRARRIGAGGGGLAAIAVVAVLVPTVFAGGPPAEPAEPAGIRQQDPSEYPIALDPNVEYIWGADESRFDEANESDAYSTTPATAELNTAWQAALDDLGFQAQPGWGDEVQRHNDVLTPDKDQSGVYGGWAGEESLVLAERPVYSASASDDTDQLSMEVYPAGSFLVGAGTQAKNPSWLLPDPRYLVPGCDPFTRSFDPAPAQTVMADVTFECVDSDGPDGERILSVRPSHSWDGHTTRMIAYLVVYRTDGTAVRITDRSWNEKSPLQFTDEQMTDLALALPSVPVE